MSTRLELVAASVFYLASLAVAALYGAWRVGRRRSASSSPPARPAASATYCRCGAHTVDTPCYMGFDG